MAGFEKFFISERTQKYSFDSSVGEGLFTVPKMKRHFAYYKNSEENLKISNGFEKSLSEELKEHLVSVDWAWGERINHAAVHSFYCGYRAAVSVIDHVDLFAGTVMTKNSLLTEYELGLIRPYYARKQQSTE